MNFVSIDVETANADLSSICQIGIACYQNGLLLDTWKSYIDPEDEFDGMNISIHGIDEDIIKGSPKLPDVASQFHKYMDNSICICHTHFDKIAIHQAFEKYQLTAPLATWLDSAMVSRRTWEQFAYKGYGLYNICQYLKYSFTHHDALEDAKASAFILISAMKKTGLDLDAWMKRVKQPVDISRSSAAPYIKREGNPEGPLFGEVLVFTGALSMERSIAADLASTLGCKVESGVNKRTTILVVGDQDIKKLAGYEISSKHRRAEELIHDGHPIRILRETDFKELVNMS